MAGLQHTETMHMFRLNCLCRICGRRSKTVQNKNPVFFCKRYASELYQFHGIQVSDEESSTKYSATLCASCKTRLHTLRLKSTSAGLIKAAVDQIEATQDLWTEYKPENEIHNCSVCYRYGVQMRGRRQTFLSNINSKSAPQNTGISEVSDEACDHSASADISQPHCSTTCVEESDVKTSVDKFQPQYSSTPVNPAVRKRLFDLLSSRGVSTQHGASKNKDTSSLPTASPSCAEAQTDSVIHAPGTQFKCPSCKTPKSNTHLPQTAQKTLRPLEQLQAPLTRAEEAYLTKLVRIKLEQSEDKKTVVCKTRAHPITLKKIIKAKKTSSDVSTPMRKKRAREVEEIRKELSGSAEADLVKQQATELKHAKKSKKDEILKTAGCRQPFFSAKKLIVTKAKMSLSWAKQRELKKLHKSEGIRTVCEQKEREFQESLMCDKIEIKQQPLLVTDKVTNKELVRDTPVVVISNLPNFVSNLLDQQEKMGQLTWHNNTIPEDEIWVKIGGDHGQGSFKLVLSVVNLKTPNSSKNCYMVLVFEAKDTHGNLKKTLGSLKEQIQNLRTMTWKGKKLRLFMFGDYDFLLKMHGISGAQSKHPCLWCKVSKTDMQSDPVWQGKSEERTLKNIRQDQQNYMKAGGTKSIAKEHNSVTCEPIWDIEVTHVAPPYLHILLGVVKKHHDALLADCQSLDRQIAEVLSKESHPNLLRTTPEFQACVKNIHRLRQKNQRVDLKKVTAFSKQEGPVCAKVQEVLNGHHIEPQAYHGGAFIGNHCHKYLKDEVIHDITESIEKKAYELTDDTGVHIHADNISRKYSRLNTLYSRVHTLLSHTQPVDHADIKHMQTAISEYMKFYRGHLREYNVIPKQHILETHCLEWVDRWGFGLAVHGEQGGEEMHASVHQLARRTYGMTNRAKKLAHIMKEQLTRASPLLLDTPPKKK